jgi:hypothetical protein
MIGRLLRCRSAFGARGALHPTHSWSGFTI